MAGKACYAHINRILNARLEQPAPLIAVHRGSWGGNIIENTIAAYTAAIQLGADMFEVDIARSLDDTLYAIHDGCESRLFHLDQNIRTMTDEQIAGLTYFNSIDDVTTHHVQKFTDVLAHFRSGTLFNIDRGRRDLPQIHEALCQYPETLPYALIKTNVDDCCLDFFQNCPVKYMFMAICRSMEDVRKVLSYTEINLVGIEVIADSAEHEFFDPANLQWIRDQGLFIWMNAITLSSLPRHTLYARFDDEVAITQGPDKAWGVLLSQGCDVIQTDWPAQLRAYLNSKFS